MSGFSLRQRERFASQAAAQRKEAWGTVITFRDAEYTVIISGLQDTHQQAEGGFQQAIQAQMRILRTDLDSRPILDERFTVVETGIEYRIVGVTDNPRSPEWLCAIGPVSN